MIEHRHPTTTTQKHVLAASGNECTFPACSRLIFDLTHETLIGTIAHIRARSENGPRFDPVQSEDENRAFGNLVAMCAEHSKIIDGPKWSDFSVETLMTWKKEHEQRVANISDRNWIKPANSILRLTPEGERLQFSYWVDRTGRPQLFSSHQLAVLNALMAANFMILQLGNLPERLTEAKGADVATVLQQDWAKFKIEKSVIADLCTLFAMAGEITFAEFLGFVVQGNDPTPLVQEGARRIERMTKGEQDLLARDWFKSNRLS
jgi:hypothetical protein